MAAVGCSAQRPGAQLRTAWPERPAHSALVFAPSPASAPAGGFERTRRDAALGVASPGLDPGRYHPVWAQAAQAPALRPWPPHVDLNDQRRLDRFWRITLRRHTRR